jgi:1-deoxy-D-xylulose-5-phosphate reductoisomerase
LRTIAILGSTGSIGTQALEVVRENPDRFKVAVITANRNASLLISQAKEFLPLKVVITETACFQEVKEALAGLPVGVMTGEDALEEVVASPEIDMVLTALVGFCGLKPTLAAIEAGKDIALANKETLVVAGELVMALAKKQGVKILPVDSEHSAIFQCLAGEEENEIERLYLTASGGPFRGKDRSYLAGATRENALRHPNWTMGAKITIDSATLMNKGLEVIEAKWLFGVDVSQIAVVVHPQSVIHSLVQFSDGSLKAQMGLPDMKLPIQYALGFPDRIRNNFPRFSFMDYPQLTFEQPDTFSFPNLELAYEAIRRGGNSPCVINAANEMVVAAFLNNEVGFLQMSEVIGRCMNRIAHIASPSLSDYLETDRETRILAREMVTKLSLTYQS